jgi:hypothetical protein
MKHMLFCLLLVFVSFSVQAERMEAHGNHEDEVKCFAEIRKLNCGNPDEHKKFISCVNSKVNKLSQHCRIFHQEELERMEGHQHE